MKNLNGSGIGQGHALGATGGRIMVALLHVLKKKRKAPRAGHPFRGGEVSMACALEKR
jgi:acetyl-CoA C-acetyltransferase